MKRMFKSTISLLLIAAFLLTPLVGTTASAVGEISANDTATKAESESTEYVYSNDDYFVPEYVPGDDNIQISPIQGTQTSDTTSTTSTSSGRLADGVYWINTGASSAKYLDTQDGGTSSGTPVVQWTYSAYINGDTNVYNLNQLFKVTYIGTNDGEDYYTIRPMTNNELGLSAPTSSSSNLVDVKKMSTSEDFSDIAWYQKWVIKMYSDSDGDLLDYYTIENRLVDGNTYLSADNDDANGSQITLTDKVETLRQTWLFHPYTGPTINEVSLTKFTAGVAKGKYFNYDAIIRSTEIGINGPVSFSVTDRDGNATDMATITSSGGVLRALKMGEVQLRMTVPNKTGYWPYDADIQFEEGTYMFRTKESEKYLESINSSAGSLQQGTFDGSNVERWVFTYNHTKGYYQIKNENTSLYLTAPNATRGTVLEQTSSTDILDRQLWSFTKTNNEYYKVQPKSMLGTNNVMSVDEGAFESEIIMQQEYSDDSNYRDEWVIIEPSNEIQLEAQQQSNWCWAASARMASMNYMKTDISQASAAVYMKLGVKTSNPTEEQMISANSGADVWTTADTVEYFLSSNNSYGHYFIYSEATLRDLLEDSNPVIALRGWYNDGTNRENGHYVVIYGYHWDGTDGMYVYDIFDPSPVGEGSFYSRSYANICNGRETVFSGDFTDTGVWDGSVVYTHGDYLNTILWSMP